MSALRIRPAGVQDRELVAGLLRELSPDSAYLRFQTGIGVEPAPGLVAALIPDGLRGSALLGLVDDRLVAHGLWVRVGASPVAEIGIVVADAQQGQGIGTRIASALIADLAARGIDRVEVFASATNVAVTRMVARQAPHAVRDRDGATVTYAFATPPRRVAVRTVA
ncbi:GNAT family N-acetyltransferase [Nocardioides sp. URHA0020]|uniref:GNAT family N-acetyltransferase n=1 Tax=Nocardioides sp. URHA0020 TaxID=1380392 RepID=UPI0004907A83|nr:GNAT family N-acetyltransferase [Nocardioides sp. URHA0020]